VFDVSELGDPVRAWGFFVTNRDARAAREAIGSGGQVLPRKATFAKGRYYVEIAASPDKDHRAPLRAFVDAFVPKVPGEATIPAAVSFFPKDGLDAESVRLVPESVLGLRLLKSGFVAQYAGGRALIVPEASPEAAGATLGKLRERFKDAQPVQALGEEAIAARDPYLGGLVFFRKGAHVAGVANVPAGQDGLALAKALAAQLP